jgi:hypothetical protein
MRISCRDWDEDDITRIAYMGQAPQHEPIPYPTSLMNPQADNPERYGDLIDNDFCCRANGCSAKLIRKLDPTTGQYFAYCPKCSSRYSLKHFDSSYSHYGMQPGTFNNDSGSSVNNESQGVYYHMEPVNRDTWTGNLGKN